MHIFAAIALASGARAIRRFKADTLLVAARFGIIPRI
jgi:hypothetical protein